MTEGASQPDHNIGNKDGAKKGDKQMKDKQREFRHGHPHMHGHMNGQIIDVRLANGSIPEYRADAQKSDSNHTIAS